MKTLTDSERAELANGDPRLRAMLERVDDLGPDELARLHGALRASAASEPRARLSVGDRPSNLTGDLFVQICGVAPVHLDIQHGASNTSVIELGMQP